MERRGDEQNANADSKESKKESALAVDQSKALFITVTRTSGTRDEDRGVKTGLSSVKGRPQRESAN